MDNTILNVRFGSRHLQIVRLGDWLGEIRMGRSPVTFRRNSYHANKSIRAAPGWRWFEIY